MRLVEIEENLDPKELREFIEKNCQPFLEQISNDIFHYRMYRGTHSISYAETSRIVSVRKDRRPSATYPEDNIKLITSFKNNGLVANRDNSIFCSGASVVAGAYGNVFCAFPIGSFSFTWSPEIDDLYEYIVNHGRLLKDGSYDEFVKANYIDHDLKKAIESKNEIMIACDKVLLINNRKMEEVFS